MSNDTEKEFNFDRKGKQMKLFKRILTFALTAIMVVALGATGVYADETYSITVNNTNPSTSIVGKTYSAYKLFDVTYSGTNYSYSINTGNNPFCTTAGAKAVLDDYFTFTPTSDTNVMSVTVKNDPLTDAQARILADRLQPYIKDATAVATATADSESVTINLSEAGYYIVTGTVKPKDPARATEEVVSAVILDNATPTATVNPKASVPTLDKKITKVDSAVEDLLDDAGKAAVAKVGSTVSYELDSIVPDVTGYSDYFFEFGDRITNGLDYVANSFKLKVGEGAETTITPTFTTDKKSFTYQIPFEILRTYTTGAKIVLTYDCKVNSSALTTDFENNTASLEYSRSPYTNDTNHTPEKNTYVIDLTLDVLKVDESETNTLRNAKFKLYRLNGTEKQYYKYDATNGVTWGTAGEATEFTTGDDGKFTQKIGGLDKGTYYLEETEAPQGYNRLQNPIEVVISVNEADGKVTYSATYDEENATMTNGTVDITTQQEQNKQPVATGKVINRSGTQLPGTGGIGTTIFYVVGTLLVVGAGIVLVARRKASE